MSMKSFIVIPAACLLTAANAFLHDLPKPTVVSSDYAIDGFSPKTTDGPTWELMKRQASSSAASGSASGYLAPDNTCGYVSGSLGAAYTCASTQRCGGLVDNQIKYRPGACCDIGGDCHFMDTCIPYAQLSASCDHACMIDINTYKCTQSKYPYCYTYQIAGLSMTFFDCDSVTATTPDIMSTTFFGETDGRTWKVLDLASSTASSASAFQLSSVTSKAAASSSSSASSASSASVAAANNSASSSSSGSSTPIGAIVGGVVGGLAVIAAIIGVIVFACLRKRKNRRQVAAASSQYGQPGSNGPPPPGGQPMMYAPGAAPMGAAGYYSQDAHKPTHDSMYKPSGAVVTETPLQNQHYGQQQPTSPIPSTTSPAPPYQHAQFNNEGPNELPLTVAVPPSGYTGQPQDGRLSGAVSPVEHGAGGFPNGYMPAGNPQPGPYHPPTTNASGQPVYELRGQS